MLGCPHEDVARTRRGLTASSAPVMLQQLSSRIEAAYVCADRPLPEGVVAKRTADLRALSDAAAVWSSADGKLFHMLAALPWPARVAAGGGTPLFALLWLTVGACWDRPGEHAGGGRVQTRTEPRS